MNTDLPLCTRSGTGEKAVSAFGNATDLLRMERDCSELLPMQSGAGVENSIPT